MSAPTAPTPPVVTRYLAAADRADFAELAEVQVRVEGNFPGGVADLTYRFVLLADAITELSIVE